MKPTPRLCRIRKGLLLHALSIALLHFAWTGLVGSPTADAQTTKIKLATLVPSGSVWDKALRDMGAEWTEETEGRVRLQIYSGGIAGDDPDMVRKMRIGQLHGATVTVSGLTEIDAAFALFEIPGFFTSWDELTYVLDALEPELQKRLRDKGFEHVHWVPAGWIHFFSKDPIVTIEDLRTKKIFTWAGDDMLADLWRESGFHPVPLALTDVVLGLQTGMFEAMPSTPLAALSLQWFRHAPHMVDLPLGQLIGATIVTSRAWSRVSEDDRDALRAAGLRSEKGLWEEIPRQEEEAIRAMKERGLKIGRVVGTPAEDGWREVTERFAVGFRDAFVPPEIYQAAIRARAEFRAQNEESASNVEQPTTDGR